MILGEQAISGTRYEATTWVNGEPVDGASSAISLRGSVQTATERDLELLPEGERSGEALVVSTKFGLRCANDDTKTPADRLQLESAELGEIADFKVMKVKRVRAIIPHVRAVAVRL